MLCPLGTAQHSQRYLKRLGPVLDEHRHVCRQIVVVPAVVFRHSALGSNDPELVNRYKR